MYLLKLIVTIVLLLTVLPSIVFATDIDIENTFLWIYKTFDFFVQIILVFASLLFFWGVVKLILTRDDKEMRQLAYSYMFNGVIAILITIIIWILFTAFIKYFNFEILEPIVDLVTT